MLAVLIVPAFGVAVSAQTASSPPSEFSFDARIVWTGGSESRVEVKFEGWDLPTTVDVRDNNGQWASMRDVEGDWDNDHVAKDYHVEAGNHVWFRLGWSVPKNFVVEYSCAYDHEAYVRDCSIARPPLPPVELDFVHRGGNEWWADVSLTGPDTEAVSDWAIRVEDDQGGSEILTKRTWSAYRYAGPVEVPSGTRIRFIAGFVEQPDVVSCWFVHPVGTEQCDDAKLPPWTRARYVYEGQTYLYTASDRFEHFQIKDGWVQVEMWPPSDFDQVQVRINGGTWQGLALRSWGAWADSIHVPANAILQFRAQRDDTWIYSNSGWTGMPTRHVPSLDPAYNVQFANTKGNNWWVQTNLYSDEYIEKVRARTEGGAWRDLTFQSWGDWATSFYVANGQRVQFAAVDWQGREVESGWVTWPPAP
jgi:hypothetical protein